MRYDSDYYEAVSIATQGAHDCILCKEEISSMENRIVLKSLRPDFQDRHFHRCCLRFKLLKEERREVSAFFHSFSSDEVFENV